MIEEAKVLIKSDTGKDTIIVFTGTIINALLGGLFFILAPRLLGPTQYGLFSVVISSANLVANLANFGIDNGILRFFNRDELTRKRVLKLALQAYLLIGMFISVIGFFLASPFANILGYPQIAPLLRIASASIILFLLTDFFLAVLQAKKEFVKSSLVNISSNIARLTILALAAYFFTVDLYLLTILFFAVILISIMIGKLFVPFDFLNVKDHGKDFRTFFSFNFWIASAITISSIPVDNYLLVKISGAASTGIFAAAYKLISIADQFAGNFSRVLSSRLSSFNNDLEARNYTIKTIPFVLSISLLIATGAVIASPLLNFLLGKQYQESVAVFRILSISFAFYFANTTAVSVILYYFGKSKDVFIITAVVFLTRLISGMLLIPNFHALGAAYAELFSAIVSFSLFNLYVFTKFLRIKST